MITKVPHTIVDELKNAFNQLPSNCTFMKILQQIYNSREIIQNIVVNLEYTFVRVLKVKS